jgi:hypothetical protein
VKIKSGFTSDLSVKLEEWRNILIHNWSLQCVAYGEGSLICRGLIGLYIPSVVVVSHPSGSRKLLWWRQCGPVMSSWSNGLLAGCWSDVSVVLRCQGWPIGSERLKWWRQMCHPDMGWGNPSDSSSRVVSGRPCTVINYRTCWWLSLKYTKTTIWFLDIIASSPYPVV